jgi:hypothetical protein
LLKILAVAAAQNFEKIIYSHRIERKNTYSAYARPKRVPKRIVGHKKEQDGQCGQCGCFI